MLNSCDVAILLYSIVNSDSHIPPPRPFYKEIENQLSWDTSRSKKENKRRIHASIRQKRMEVISCACWQLLLFPRFFLYHLNAAIYWSFLSWLEMYIYLNLQTVQSSSPVETGLDNVFLSLHALFFLSLRFPPPPLLSLWSLLGWVGGWIGGGGDCCSHLF